MIVAQVFEALTFAAIQHQYQRRGGYKRLPYINHLIKVADILIHTAGETDPDILRAAVLHDVLEDTDTTPEEMTQKFGTAVCSIVQELTDDMSLPYDERKRIQVNKAPYLSDAAQKIKLADKTCNIRDIVDYPLSWNTARKVAYIDWSEEVIDKLRGKHLALEQLFDETVAYARNRLATS